MRKRGEIALKEQFLLLFTIFYYLMLDFYVKRRTGFSLRDKRLFEIIEDEITRVECFLLLIKIKYKQMGLATSCYNISYGPSVIYEKVEVCNL